MNLYNPIVELRLPCNSISRLRLSTSEYFFLLLLFFCRFCQMGIYRFGFTDLILRFYYRLYHIFYVLLPLWTKIYSSEKVHLHSFLLIFQYKIVHHSFFNPLDRHMQNKKAVIILAQLLRVRTGNICKTKCQNAKWVHSK